MKKGKNIIFRTRVQPFDTKLVICFLGSTKEILPSLKKYHSTVNIIESVTDDCMGESGTYQTRKNGQELTGFYIYVRNVFTWDDLDHILVHEIIHASWHILDHHGVEITADNHEMLAYMTDYIYQVVKKRYKKEYK